MFKRLYSCCNVHNQKKGCALHSDKSFDHNIFREPRRYPVFGLGCVSACAVTDGQLAKYRRSNNIGK
jgi:hypothetical protein